MRGMAMRDGMTVKDMVAEWLRANHYDGLCNPSGECGCGLGDLMPCQCVNERECMCAYSVPAPDGTEYDRFYCTSNADQNEPSDTLESVALDMYREIIANDERHPEEIPPADDERTAYGSRLNALGVAV